MKNNFKDPKTTGCPNIFWGQKLVNWTSLKSKVQSCAIFLHRYTTEVLKLLYCLLNRSILEYNPVV